VEFCGKNGGNEETGNGFVAVYEKNAQSFMSCGQKTAAHLVNVSAYK
jgi:hypothetical protein